MAIGRSSKASVKAPVKGTASQDEDKMSEKMWLVDYIEGFMKAQTWSNPIQEFIESKYHLFIDCTEEGDMPC